MASPTVHTTNPAADAAIEKPMHPALEVWHHFSKNLGAVIGLVIIVLIVLMAIFADLIAPAPYYKSVLSDNLKFPSWDHWMGTDPVGRDLLGMC